MHSHLMAWRKTFCRASVTRHRLYALTVLLTQSLAGEKTGLWWWRTRQIAYAVEISMNCWGTQKPSEVAESSHILSRILHWSSHFRELIQSKYTRHTHLSLCIHSSQRKKMKTTYENCNTHEKIIIFKTGIMIYSFSVRTQAPPNLAQILLWAKGFSEM